MRWLAPVLLLLFCPTQVPAGELPASFGPHAEDMLAGMTSSPTRATTAGSPETPKSPEQLNIRSMAARIGSLKADRLPGTRGEREVRIYATASNSVVLILATDGIGSGALLRPDGTIVTNWHVVSSSPEVGVVFKPATEGRRVTKADVYRGRVVRIDEVADLALVKVEGVPANARPVPLGSLQDIAVGSDVHAIGHPTGESWTYTKGFVSQIRRGYEWSTDGGMTHKADVVQTQTPINPGNSGGPLLNDQGQLVGVNSFKAEGEGLNFAVSVGEVRTLLAATRDRRLARRDPETKSASVQGECEARELKRGRSARGDADKISYDISCGGKPDSVLTIPDDRSKPITLFIESRTAAEPNILLIDNDRDGKWDVSLYDTDKDGKPDMVGYHRNGEPKPYRFEPYVASR